MGTCYTKLQDNNSIIIQTIPKNYKKYSLNEEVQNIEINDYQSWQLNAINQVQKSYLQIEFLGEEYLGFDNISKANYFLNLSKKVDDNNLKLGLLLLSIKKDNTNEDIIFEYLKILKILSNEIKEINFINIFTYYERFLSLKSLEYFPEKKKIKDNFEQYFELINNFINTKKKYLNQFIENKKNELNLTEKYINNNPITYFKNKEIYFYIQMEYFISYFNDTNIYKRQFFLINNKTVINYFKNNFPEDEKEIETLLFTINYCKEGDNILKSFHTFLYKPLTIEEIKKQIKNENIKSIELIYNKEKIREDLIIKMKNDSIITLENFSQYDTYSIVDFFSNFSEIQEYEKLKLMNYNLFQKKNQYKLLENSFNKIVSNYILSTLSKEVFNEIFNYSPPIDFKKYFQNSQYINDLLEKKIIIYPFESKDFFAATQKFFNKIYISGFNLIDLEQEIFKFTRLAINLVFFIHEFQHLLNSEIAFITGKKKYFNSNKIGLDENELKSESILFGKTIENATYLQFYYLINCINFKKKISIFKQEFNKYDKIKNEEIDEVIKNPDLIYFFNNEFKIPIKEIKNNKRIKFKNIFNERFIFVKDYIKNNRERLVDF